MGRFPNGLPILEAGVGAIPAPIPNTFYNPVTNSARTVLWVPQQDTFIAKLFFMLETADSADGGVELFVFNRINNKVFTTGNIAGAMNGAPGVKPGNVTVPGVARAGVPHHVGIWTPTVTLAGTAVAAYKMSAANGLFTAFGATFATQLATSWLPVASPVDMTAAIPGSATNTIPFVGVLSA